MYKLKLAIILIIAILFLISYGLSWRLQRYLDLYYLDIGQGDATLIINTKRQKILIDCGPDQKTVEQLDLLLPFWDRKIDYLFISHDHDDHWGGLAAILNKYQINKIFLAYPPKISSGLSASLDLAKNKGSLITNLTAPATIILPDQSRLKILWPTPEQLQQWSDEPNNQSLVIYWLYGQKSFLWTGDLESSAEEILLKKLPPRVDIIKIAHHGSWTATSPKWLESWQPTAAIISVGLNNKFNLPTPITLERLKRLNIKHWRTDQLGRIHLSTDGQTIWRGLAK
ncbi:MAG TPA: MBL fold metallo-hydrolase [bacterium]|nr:MBL fold metallo-hydrolase [bacterium]